MFGLRTAAAVIAALLAVSVSPVMAQSQPAKPPAIGTWESRCESGNKNCVAAYVSEALLLIIGRGPDKELRMAIRVPPRTKQGEPVGMRLDNGGYLNGKIAGCSEQLCEAVVANPKVVKELADAMKPLAGGVVAFMAEGNIMIVPFSLKGFSKAFGTL
jgi:invasion protein IalB